jgi:hypothetical protein
LLEYPGRPVLSTIANNTQRPAAALLDYLPPLQTAPCDLVAAAAPATGGGSRSRSSSSSSSSSAFGSTPQAAGGAGLSGEPAQAGAVREAAVPRWDEDLDLDVAPGALAAEDALLLVEVLQLPRSFSEAARQRLRRPRSGGSAAGSPADAVERVAWGFLRLRGAGVAGLGDEGRRVSLQLFHYLRVAGEGRA